MVDVSVAGKPISFVNVTFPSIDIANICNPCQRNSVSFLSLTLCSDLELSTEDVIRQHRAKFLYEDDLKAHRITVRRGPHCIESSSNS